MTPLYIPLTSLPAPVPMWTPVLLDGRDPYAVIYADDSGEEFLCCPAGKWYCYGPGVATYGPERLAVDLSPPPLDPNGHPTRIDALPVLVGMLARAMGRPEGHHLFRSGMGIAWLWRLETATPEGVVTYGFERTEALMRIDMSSPLADRFAVAALFTARVWENV